ncbi:MAG: XRE family transcriptional regulator [Achromobacter sp.]|jgi:DNA-binding XRE family transcriptional regulator
MPKRSDVIDALPPAARAQLRELGLNLAIARKRRKETQKSWAQRIGVSEPTLVRLEKGDPSVSMGAYATALWLVGRSQALPELAAPELDRGALEQNIRAVTSQRAVRSRANVVKGAGKDIERQSHAVATGRPNKAGDR